MSSPSREHYEARLDDAAPESELERFSRYCGNKIGGKRRYGLLEILGIVANLKHNRFLKRSGETVMATGLDSTRDAFLVDIDRPHLDENSHLPRVRAIISALPDKADTTFRVKDIKYGNHNAMWEVLSSQLYGLTGLTAPDTRMLVHEDYGTRLDGCPKVFVASPKISGYFDLGDFLINAAAGRFIDEKFHANWHALAAEIDAINKKSREGEILTGADKLRRLKLMSEIYEFLPDYFHQEIEKSFIASKFIANWDFANFGLNNIGCRFTLNPEGEIVGFESSFVDFGNSGAIGFGGKYKAESLEAANTEAKPLGKIAVEFDPALSITEEEMRLVLTAFDGQDYSENSEEELKKLFSSLNPKELLVAIEALPARTKDSVLFKLSHHIRQEEAGIDIAPNTTGLLTFSDLPRNLPFGILLRPALRHKTTAAAFEGRKIYRDSEIEMAFRLSLIPDEAIDYLAQKWYLSDEFPTIFPVPEKFKDGPRATAAGVAEIFKKRRDDLVKLVAPEIIDQWVADNKAQALAAQQEVELSLVKKTTHPNPYFEGINQDAALAPAIEIKGENSFSSRLVRTPTSKEKPNLAANFIHSQILQKESELEKERSTKLRAALSLRDACERIGDEEIGKIIAEKSYQIECELAQKKQEALLDFVAQNMKEWKKSLGLNEKPNCDLFNLPRSRELYRAKFRIDYGVSGKILDQAELMERNDKIHQENIFVFQGFIKTLEGLAPTLLTHETPCASPLHSSSSQAAQPKQRRQSI